MKDARGELGREGEAVGAELDDTQQDLVDLRRRPSEDQATSE